MTKLFCSIGTGPGIGVQTALRFAREGYKPLLAARNGDRLDSLAREIREQTGTEVVTVVLDAADDKQIVNLMEKYGTDIEVLHYNAAVLRPQHIEEATEESLVRDIQVNLTAALVAVREILPWLRQRKRGSILMTGGGFALFPSSEYLTLSIGKAGIRCFCQALFPDLAEDNVHIATVTVKKVVEASEGDPQKIADTFWKLHSQPRSAWTWEENYG